jgi:acyl-CoA oxidase
MTYNDTRNDYAQFNHVRIPRDSLLGANEQVLSDGTCVRSKGTENIPYSKLSYAMLMYMRAMIIKWYSSSLAQTLTIATRYSTLREQ